MDDSLGWKFWLWCLGVALAIGLGGMILFLIIGGAWYAWGAFGTLLVLSAILLAFGWIYDRRQQRKYEDVSA